MGEDSPEIIDFQSSGQSTDTSKVSVKTGIVEDRAALPVALDCVGLAVVGVIVPDVRDQKMPDLEVDCTPSSGQ